MLQLAGRSDVQRAGQDQVLISGIHNDYIKPFFKNSTMQRIKARNSIHSPSPHHPTNLHYLCIHKYYKISAEVSFFFPPDKLSEEGHGDILEPKRTYPLFPRLSPLPLSSSSLCPSRFPVTNRSPSSRPVFLVFLCSVRVPYPCCVVSC